MSADLERLPEEIDAATRHQMDLALMKARDIEGTMLNDLEVAMNLVKRYQVAMKSACLPDPNEHQANTLLRKYKMIRDPNESTSSRHARQARELENARARLAEVREKKQIESSKPKQIEAPKEDEIVDAEVVE
jgi:hypothetical protein